MDHNVLVLAMSLLPGWQVLDVDEPYEGTYKYRDPKTGEVSKDEYHGIGQLEAVPLFIQEHFGVGLTHIVMYTTPETKLAITYKEKNGPFHNAEDTCRRIWELYQDKLFDGQVLDAMQDHNQMSHVEFFERRMRNEGVSAEFVPIDINNVEPEVGFEDLEKRVRGLYRDYLEDKKKDPDCEWHLWIDVHGAFREISMAMFGLIQMLAAPDEQDFARFNSRDEELAEAIKRMGDGRDTVPIDAVYTIEYDQSRNVQLILNRTDFYANFTRPAIQAYLNYGQYAQMFLKSTADEGPYSFISYKHGESRLERYALLGSMKQRGYRYWYDDAIELQHDWEKTLQNAVKKCSTFIAVVTKGYESSYVCLCELSQALEAGKLVVLVSPDDTPLYASDHDWRAQGKDRDGNVVEAVVTSSDLGSIVQKQQLAFKSHILNDVFQESAVADRLEKLRAYDPRFAETWSQV